MIYFEYLLALGLIAGAAETTAVDEEPLEEIAVLATRRAVKLGDLSSSVATADGAAVADRKLASLVDEIYYEHHVRGTPLWHCCWKQNTVTSHTLVHSYEVFGKLRELGIRAHSWV